MPESIVLYAAPRVLDHPLSRMMTAESAVPHREETGATA
jgi:hypothetical protein